MEKEEKLWNSNYLKVMTANFSMSFAFYLLTPLLPLYLSEHFAAASGRSTLCWISRKGRRGN